jgi:hypothetical protein
MAPSLAWKHRENAEKIEWTGRNADGLGYWVPSTNRAGYWVESTNRQVMKILALEAAGSTMLVKFRERPEPTMVRLDENAVLVEAAIGTPIVATVTHRWCPGQT